VSREALSRASWPIERVHEAMLGLALRAGYVAGPPAVRMIAPPSARLSGAAIDRWLERAAESIGVDAEPVVAQYDELRDMLSGIGPALIPADAEDRRWLAIVSATASQVRILTPDDEIRAFALDDVRGVIASDLDAGGDQLAGPVLEAAGLTDSSERARVLLRETLVAHRDARRGLAIRPHPSAPLATIARDARLAAPAAVLLASHLASAIALVLAWVALGSGVLGGRVDVGWLIAAGLLALSRVPLRALAAAAQGRFAIATARALKQRLLWGALRIDRDQTRREGAGQLLARVLEAEQVESLALDGGVASALALIELAIAAAVLVISGASMALLALLVVVLVGAVVIARFAARQRAWTDVRLGLTHELVERMVGHRTRLAQEPPARWHEEEDIALARSLEGARAADRIELVVRVMSRAYLVLALASLAPAFVLGADAAELAGGIGGALLAQQALAALSGGLDQLVRALIGATRVAPLLRAAAGRPAAHDPSLAVDDVRARELPVLELRGATLRYPGRLDAALRDASLRLSAPDRLLCTGPSGGGKSTLAQVLSGLRAPSAGLVLAGGLDPVTLGDEEWRRRIAFVPQFQENHVFATTLAFNLLMGDQWPPEAADLGRAEEVCRALELGPLIDRMPAGLLQQVGDSGWQLSHGERSRVFLARALLSRRARALILDESFGALDPGTLERCLAVTIDRAPALIVIAHP
jgi:ATP-binding cassette subfamily B protein